MLIDPYRAEAAVLDPYWGNVITLFDATGPAWIEHTGVTDSIAETHTPGGSGGMTTAQVQTGTHSYHNPADAAASGNGLTFTANPEMVFDGQFTFEGWYRVDSYTDAHQAFVHGSVSFATNGWFGFFVKNDGQIYAGFRNTSGSTAFVAAAVGVFTGLLDTWVHVAWTRDASNLSRIFLNGVQIASGTIAGTFGANHNMFVGKSIEADNGGLNSWISQVRITKGVARYSSTFTPETVFPTQG